MPVELYEAIGILVVAERAINTALRHWVPLLAHSTPTTIKCDALYAYQVIEHRLLLLHGLLALVKLLGSQIEDLHHRPGR